ncbi:MAG: FKBP-type peptidyl-prolyl cis-trans isomerase [Lachnospiraceae bacterium]|nr:FKBP-type peptidyl-prolyl cis-trans isomerase [Lachnospiraceae bacterium]
MKKKLALMCMAGVMVVSMSACGSGKSDPDAQETAQTVEETQTDTALEERTDSGQPTEIERVSDREDYVGLQDLDIEEYITLADYKSMKVSAVKPAVDDAAITEYIDSELLVGEITDRAVEEGDVTDIDFVGRKDGVAFDGGTASGYRLIIGSGGFIPGFEDGLVGVMPGETVDLNLAFPDPYQYNPDLAGQEVVFTVTVNFIEGSAAYETVTPEELEQLGLPYKTKAEVWEAGKKDVEKNAEETFAANARSAVVQKLVEESAAQSIPEYLVEEEVQNYNFYMQSIAAMYGMDLESFLDTVAGLTQEEYDSQANEMCTEIVKQYLVMEAVARAEGIEITDEMIHERADEEAVEYGYASGDALIDEAGYTTYRMSIVQEQVIERLMGIVSVEEEAAQEAAES